MTKLLIGDNSFIGVSHLSQERARERTENLTIASIVDIIKTASACGATGYTFSTHPVNLQILTELKKSEKIQDRLELYPVLPYAQAYVRLANEKGMRGLVDETLSKLPLLERTRTVLQTGYSTLRLDVAGILKSYLDIELTPYINAKPKNSNLQSVLLHEVATDLCVGLHNMQFLETFAQQIKDKYHVTPGFVTYNLVSFVKLFQEQGVSLEDVLIMTPFNKIGYQMSQSLETCESCLSNLHQGEVIAMSILAGGYLNLNQALDYLRTLPNLSGIAVGVSSTTHAKDTFTQLNLLPKQEPLSAQHREQAPR